MASPKNLLPECGLYKTTKPLPGNEDKVPAGTIVYFHNHSDSGLPQVLTADHNVHNRWHFHGPPIEFRGLSWADSLQRLPEEGFFTLKKELTFDGGKWPKGALVQLGYTKEGQPIVFIGRVRSRLAENDLFFSDKGVALKGDQLALLERAQIYQEPSEGTPEHGPANQH
jgi:hypothetical protein